MSRGGGWLHMSLGFCLGCQPSGEVQPTPCHAEPPPAGEVLVVPISCGDMRLDGGEGRAADHWMANTRFRAIIRHPQDSQTLVGIGGGTVVDAAPWGESDRLHEVVPIVGGGALDVERFEVLPHRILLSGTVVDLPDRPADTPGEWREVAWVIQPDVPYLELEGADGMWVHPGAGLGRLGTTLYSETVTYAPDGDMVDLGGVLRYEGATRLVIAPPAEAWPDGTQLVSGSATEATHVSFLKDGGLVGRVPTVGGMFSAVVPGDVDGVRAEASGRPWSWVAPPGEGMELALGPPSWLAVSVAWADDQHPRPFAMNWSAADGRRGELVLAATGGLVSLGEGVFDITVSAGPAYQVFEAHIELRADQTAPLGLRPALRFDSGPFALAALGWHGDRSRSWRGSDAASTLDGWVAGLDFLVVAPEDEIGSASGKISGLPTLATKNGSRTMGDGWEILSWPWAGNEKRTAHGAVDPTGRSAVDGLAAASGGPKTNRWTVIDLQGLAALPAPHDAVPRPTYVQLTDPGPLGPSGGVWDPWFAWLDAAALLTPTGPLTWVRVADPSAVTPIDVEAGLISGHTAATSGPLATLTVDGWPPGSIATPRPDRIEGRVIALEVSAALDLDTVALVVDGEVHTSWTPSDDLLSRRFVVPDDDLGQWALVAGWGDTGQWVATGPVWTGPPLAP